MHPHVEKIHERREEMLEFLEMLVNMDSPSTDPVLTTAISRAVGMRCEESGASVKYLPVEGAGDHVMATWGSDDGEGSLLLLCHLDTVWPEGESEERPFTIKEGRAYGPGVHDMKCGTVQAICAIEEAFASGNPPGGQVVLLCNTDEEVGSKTSRPIIEEMAGQARTVMVFEPSVPPRGSIKTFRKGVGGFTVKTTGKAVHSGADHEAGISAIEEMARQILHLHSLTNYETGTTVNVGVIDGGTRSNVVAAECTANVDVRVSSMDEGRRIEKVIKALRPHLDGATVEVSGGVERPPMERSEEIVALFEKARALGQEMGFEITEAGTGGASDGNYTAAMGVPTLDGLGAVGAGGHSLDEWINIDKMIERTALAVRLLQTL